jgi:hypothetical protein
MRVGDVPSRPGIFTWGKFDSMPPNSRLLFTGQCTDEVEPTRESV